MVAMSLLFVVVLAATTIPQSYSACLRSYSGKTYETCIDLPQSGAKLSWSWDNETRLMDGLFAHQPEASGGWVAWGINVNGTNSMQTSSIIACYTDPAETSVVAKSFILSGTSASSVYPGSLVDFTSSVCEKDSSTSPETLYITFQINLGRKPKINQVYASGPGVDTSTTNILREHGPRSRVGNPIDIRNTSTSASDIIVSDLHTDEKNVHGVLNVIGWGVLLPLGALVARYGKFADPLWFYLHALLQSVGYVIGVVGFGYGIKLKSWSSSVRTKHLILGIVIFALATLQILSVLIKPKKDSKNRIYWRVFHFLVGVAVIALAIVNNLHGFHILADYGDWRKVYIIFLIVIGAAAIVLEIISWVVWFSLGGDKKPSKNLEDEENFNGGHVAVQKD